MILLSRKSAALPASDRSIFWLHHHQKVRSPFLWLIIICLLSGFTRDVLHDAMKPDNHILGLTLHWVSPVWMGRIFSVLASGSVLLIVAALATWHLRGMFTRKISREARHLHRQLVSLVIFTGLLAATILIAAV